MGTYGSARRAWRHGVAVLGIVGMLLGAPQARAADKTPFPVEGRSGHPPTGGIQAPPARMSGGPAPKAAKLAAQYWTLRHGVATVAGWREIASR